MIPTCGHAGIPAGRSFGRPHAAPWPWQCIVKTVVLVGVIGLLPGCRTEARDLVTATDYTPRLPEDVFTLHRAIPLFEDAEVINVAPFVSVDPLGGFLVTDGREGQVRGYGFHGELRFFFGTKGDGPGEFKVPVGTVRLPGGTLANVDIGRGVRVFDPSGDEVLHSYPSPLMIIYGVRALSDSTLLLIGRARPSTSAPLDDAPNLLHVFNLDRGELVHSFFPTPGDQIARAAAMSYGFAHAAVHGDTVSAVFALTDTIYQFRLNGSELGSFHVPLQSFSPVVDLPPEGGGRRERQAWSTKLVRLESLFVLPDGSFLVQFEQSNTLSAGFNLARVSSTGELLFERRHTPRLVALLADTLVFESPLGIVPNRWQLSTLKE